MSLAFVTDLHLDNYRPFSKILSNGVNSRLLDQLDVVRKVSKQLEELKPEAVIFLGDMFNGITESLPKIIYNAAFLTVQAWSKAAPLYLLVGNHDIYRGMHVFSTFGTLPNVHIISHTTRVKLDGYEIDMIPWENPLPKERGDICAGHVAVNGTYVDADRRHLCVDSSVQPTSFAGYKYVLLGHFHNPQVFPVPDVVDARYIGAVMQTDRRTSPMSLGITILEDENLSLYPIESPKIYHFIIANKEDKLRFMENNYIEPHYFKLTVTSPEVDFPNNLDRTIIEYDLPAVASTRLSVSDDKATAWDEKLLLAVNEFIEKSNTVLDKEALKSMAKELL